MKNTLDPTVVVLDDAYCEAQVPSGGTRSGSPRRSSQPKLQQGHGDGRHVSVGVLHVAHVPHGKGEGAIATISMILWRNRTLECPGAEFSSTEVTATAPVGVALESGSSLNNPGSHWTPMPTYGEEHEGRDGEHL